MVEMASVLILLCASLAPAQSVPVSEELRAEVRAEWQRDERETERKVNPGGEVMGCETWEDAPGAVDGKMDGRFGFHTIYSQNPWWHVDLGETVHLHHIVIYNRNDGGCQNRAYGMKVLVSPDGKAWRQIFQHTDEPFGGIRDGKPLVIDLAGKGMTARWVRCEMEKRVSFHLDEVEVYGVDDAGKNIALHKSADQSSAGRSSRPKANAFRTRDEGHSLEHSAKAIARGRRLLEALEGLDGDARADLAGELDALGARLVELRAGEPPDQPARREFYIGIRQVTRRLALSNPLLEFDDILFVKRRPGTLAHMCDQYFGSLARAGGSLFVLEDFRDEPKLRDIIDGRLPEGSILSPDLSYDATRVLFSHCNVDPDRRSRWDGSAELAYHIYGVNVDGAGLQQLTEGPWDDIHPRWLPDGDILFLSTRRGGETRCSGRPVPTYTLHRMKPDGSDIVQLSCHETHEWHPVITPDGSILYTRWDYVDRHTNIAHNLWICRPDGSGAMAVYGNYNHDRKPWGEWQAQPIPGSHKILAIAGAHHGYAYGSVILVDPLREFDGQTPLERLTPNVPFPEAEGYPYAAYTTPWPLSEDFYLVSYSGEWSSRDAHHSVTQGIYLRDRFGNRTLVYRDPAISSINAIPLRPREKPSAYPGFLAESLPGRLREPPGPSGEGRFLVQDVRSSLSPFPDIKITGLRVVQMLPKTTYLADRPKMSVARQLAARQLVGTVPVEPDGSAHFRAPAGVPLYFQALGEDGMAVQSMRSITYLQPGETRSCVGCHEPRQSAPSVSRPLAGLREASTPTPGPDGSRPFSYIRLVQPVLDRHCIGCHKPGGKAEKKLLTGTFRSDKEWHSESYRTLAGKSLVHWFDSINGGEWIPETTPGKLGARASGLIQMLRKGHNGVELPAEDMARLCLWIDLNVPFYGSYEAEHVALQREGGVAPLDEMLQ